MKKTLSLLMVILLLVTAIGATPAVFAEETQYALVDGEFEDNYWGSSLYPGHVVKDGDWYYRLYETYNGEKKITAVCGYDGNETEITIPTELDGTQITSVEAFCLLSTTVKTIRIPNEITAIAAGNEWYEKHSSGPSVYINCEGETKLEEIIVEEGNRGFWSKDGVLYEGFSLCFYPPEKKNTEFIIPEKIDTIEAGAINTQNYLKSLTVTKDVSLIHEDAITPTLENLYLYTDKDVVSNAYDLQIGALETYLPYMPKADTIYCIEGSEAHSFYEKYNGGQRFCKKLVVLKDELIKKEDGKWYFYRGGVINVSGNYSSMSFDTKDLVKYKGKWFYTERGIWTKINTLFEYNGKWFYIKNGKWAKTATDLIKYKGKWFYVQNGKWYSSKYTLFKKNGKWFAIKAGKWFKDKAIIKYKGKEFYVNKGFVQFNYSGKVKIDGKTYKIKNGKVA